VQKQSLPKLSLQLILLKALQTLERADICKARKISKFYRALVTGILENDEVLTFPPHFCYGKFIVCYYLEGISAFFFHPLSITHGALGPHSQYATLEELENDQISLTT
jgi:hypothetical protein